MPRALTANEFIQKSISIHGEIYDYSNVNYKITHDKVEIICPIHGSFFIPAFRHLKGKGCQKCTIHPITEKEFIYKANKKHNNKYDYSLLNYVNLKTKVKIICPEHGVFDQAPDTHLHNNGCFLCGIETSSRNRTYNTDEFIQRAKNIHGDKYDYSLVDYKHNKEPIIIICHKHGKFTQTPNAHWVGKGCSRCNESKGEREIANILSKNNVIFEPQKKFEQCKKRNYLPFDFYLPKQNICIEYDGEQHYKAVDWFGGEDGLKITQENDKFKTEFCKNNNIILIRIKYNQNIEDKLNKKIKSWKI